MKIWQDLAPDVRKGDYVNLSVKGDGARDGDAGYISTHM